MRFSRDGDFRVRSDHTAEHRRSRAGASDNEKVRVGGFRFLQSRFILRLYHVAGFTIKKGRELIDSL